MTQPSADVLQEARLLAAIGDGDRGAFRELYGRYSAPLFSLAIRLVGDTGTAEEMLQDCFLKIWRHASAYDSRKSRPFTWAVTILRRTCIDELRRRGRAPEVVALAEETALPEEFASASTAGRSAEVQETATRVRAALAAVAPPRREVLELALFSTLTHAEIASRLDQPLGSVKTWIRRGLLDLRHTLKESPP
jgi:RNA polymerase sigma-70 factor (ECF subfamily)